MLVKLHKFFRERRLSKLVVSQELGRYEKPIYHLSRRTTIWVALCGEDALRTGIPATEFPVGPKESNCEKCAKLGLGGA